MHIMYVCVWCVCVCAAFVLFSNLLACVTDAESLDDAYVDNADSLDSACVDDSGVRLYVRACVCIFVCVHTCMCVACV